MLFTGKCEEGSKKLDFNRALPNRDKKFSSAKAPWVLSLEVSKYCAAVRILFLNKKGLIGDLYVQAYRGKEDENCNATLIDEEFFRIAKLVDRVLQKIISDIYVTCF